MKVIEKLKNWWNPPVKWNDEILDRIKEIESRFSVRDGWYWYEGPLHTNAILVAFDEKQHTFRHANGRIEVFPSDGWVIVAWDGYKVTMRHAIGPGYGE